MATIVSDVIQVNPMTYQNEHFNKHKTVKTIAEIAGEKFLYELPFILVKNSVDETTHEEKLIFTKNPYDEFFGIKRDVFDALKAAKSFKPYFE